MDTPEKADIRHFIAQYADEMSISQVVRFFDRMGIPLTKTMIQNYVRIGLLPPPRDKYYYNKNHLFLLAIIQALKEEYALEEIKSLFETVADTDPADLYATYMEMVGSVQLWVDTNFSEDRTELEFFEVVAQNNEMKRWLSQQLLKIPNIDSSKN